MRNVRGVLTTLSTAVSTEVFWSKGRAAMTVSYRNTRCILELGSERNFSEGGSWWYLVYQTSAFNPRPLPPQAGRGLIGPH